MDKSLKELGDVIFHEKSTENEIWLKINRQIEGAWEKASEQEKQEFMDSGAGDMLGQVIEFME